jgi:hypothetical protein
MLHSALTAYKSGKEFVEKLGGYCLCSLYCRTFCYNEEYQPEFFKGMYTGTNDPGEAIS